MKIKQIETQTRRDFYATFECEHCGNIERGYGYDDDYFHKIVIPNMKCVSCGKLASADYKPMQPKYDAHEVI